MIELTSSTGKIVGRVKKTLGQSVSKVDVLRTPRHFIENKMPLSSNNNSEHLLYLDSLIDKNILKGIHIKEHGIKNKENKHEFARRYLVATETLALINSLSDEHKKKFAEIVQALEPEKEMIRGTIFSGGEIRVIAECGPGMVINTIADLLGITYSKENPHPTFKDFSGTSAGSFPAAGMAFRALNSSMLKTTTDTDFTTFFRSPQTLENWANKFMRRGYHINTGNRTDIARGKHLKEIGSNLQVLVGEINASIRTYLLPKHLKKFGIDSNEFPIMSAIRATANLPLLFYPLPDLFNTCGNCYLEDKKGTKHYLFDPGILQKHLVPLDMIEEEIQKYKANKINKPGFYFVINNIKVKSSKAPETLFGKPTPRIPYWLYSTGLDISDLVDKYITGEPYQRTKKLGGERGFIDAYCEANDPYTGKTAKITSGQFDIPRKDRETIICANIPTSDLKEQNFESTIDQLHRKLVDPLFIQSKGKQGKNGYQLYLDDVNKVLGKTSGFENSTPPWLIGKIQTGINKVAAAIW